MSQRPHAKRSRTPIRRSRRKAFSLTPMVSGSAVVAMLMMVGNMERDRRIRAEEEKIKRLSGDMKRVALEIKKGNKELRPEVWKAKRGERATRKKQEAEALETINATLESKRAMDKLQAKMLEKKKAIERSEKQIRRLEGFAIPASLEAQKASRKRQKKRQKAEQKNEETMRMMREGLAIGASLKAQQASRERYAKERERQTRDIKRHKTAQAARGAAWEAALEAKLQSESKEEKRQRIQDEDIKALQGATAAAAEAAKSKTMEREMGLWKADMGARKAKNLNIVKRARRVRKTICDPPLKDVVADCNKVDRLITRWEGLLEQMADYIEGKSNKIEWSNDDIQNLSNQVDVLLNKIAPTIKSELDVLLPAAEKLHKDECSDLNDHDCMALMSGIKMFKDRYDQIKTGAMDAKQIIFENEYINDPLDITDLLQFKQVYNSISNRSTRLIENNLNSFQELKIPDLVKKTVMNNTSKFMAMYLKDQVKAKEILKEIKKGNDVTDGMKRSASRIRSKNVKRLKLLQMYIDILDKYWSLRAKYNQVSDLKSNNALTFQRSLEWGNLSNWLEPKLIRLKINIDNFFQSQNIDQTDFNGLYFKTSTSEFITDINAWDTKISKFVE